MVFPLDGNKGLKSEPDLAFSMEGVGADLEEAGSEENKELEWMREGEGGRG